MAEACAVNGHIQLVPSSGAFEALKADYEAMIEDGLLENTPPTFSQIVDACLEIQNRVNG